MDLTLLQSAMYQNISNGPILHLRFYPFEPFFYPFLSLLSTPPARTYSTSPVVIASLNPYLPPHPIPTTSRPPTILSLQASSRKHPSPQPLLLQ